MNKLILTALVAGALMPQMARADELVTARVPPLIASPAKLGLARVTPFTEGLKEPQGMLIDSSGDIIVCDYGAGEVLKFDLEGKKTATLATGLKGPSQIIEDMYFIRNSPPDQDKDGRYYLRGKQQFIITERKANRAVILRDGKVLIMGNEIIEPMGLTMLYTSLQQGYLYAVAHTTSKIYRLEGDKWTLIHAAPDDGDEGRYGLRCLASDGETLFVSDEVNGDVLMMSIGGRVAKFASGFFNPSGMEIRGDWLYVCDEGDGGRLWKVDKNGKKTMVAEKLGRPSNVLFINDVTALVSDRNGRVLKLTWDK